MNTGFVGMKKTVVLFAVPSTYINNNSSDNYTATKWGFFFKLSIILTNTCRRAQSYFFMTSNIPHTYNTCKNITRYTLAYNIMGA
jgi:hypothetical protein